MYHAEKHQNFMEILSKDGGSSLNEPSPKFLRAHRFTAPELMREELNLYHRPNSYFKKYAKFKKRRHHFPLAHTTKQQGSRFFEQEKNLEKEGEKQKHQLLFSIEVYWRNVPYVDYWVLRQ